VLCGFITQNNSIPSKEQIADTGTYEQDGEIGKLQSDILRRMNNE
jgi:hypothetical protein